MANRFKKETLFGCSNHTKRNPESSVCLGRALLRFVAERVRLLTCFVIDEVKKVAENTF